MITIILLLIIIKNTWQKNHYYIFSEIVPVLTLSYPRREGNTSCTFISFAPLTDSDRRNWWYGRKYVNFHCIYVRESTSKHTDRVFEKEKLFKLRCSKKTFQSDIFLQRSSWLCSNWHKIANFHRPAKCLITLHFEMNL